MIPNIPHTLIYNFLINSTVSRSPVVESSVGCNWTIEFEDGTITHSPIPGTYQGNLQCNYTNTSIYYKTNDAYDISVYNIISQLDFDKNGKLDINLDAEDLEVIVTTVDFVPYMWGPSIIEARVWK